MAKIDDDKIRERAYALWTQDGSPEGSDADYWYRAERELSEEDGLDTSEAAAQVKQAPIPAGTTAH